MKLPKVSDLDPEQLRVFAAPMTGSSLIVGPPGSGKTVLAFFRAAALQKARKRFSIVMFNNVLSEFARNSELPGIEGTLSTLTMNAWIRAWWESATSRRIPMIEAAGGRFRPPDLGAMTNIVAGLDGDRTRLDWGHLIIDEGQDFCRDLYTLLNFCRCCCFAGRPAEDRPALTVLADENQRITDTNSTLADIRQFAMIDREYALRKNYRNTRQIAAFAGFFSVGLESGTTEPPDREGELPAVTGMSDLDGSVDAVVRYATRQDSEEIGVLLPHQAECKRYYNKLKYRLRGNNRIRLQAYVSGHEEHTADKLVFDKPGTITVLCHASGKGLEFDTVFLPELQSISRQAGNEDVTKMTLYVMCTRARKNLRLMYVGSPREFRAVGVGRWFPGAETGLAVWT